MLKTSKELVTSNLEQHFSMFKRGEQSQNVSTPTAKQVIKTASARFSSSGTEYYHPLFESLNLMLPTKIRECLDKHQKITMSDGTTKEIGNIETGEWIIDKNGNQGEVKEIIINQIDEPMFHVKLRTIQEKLKITGNHKVFCIKKEVANCKHKSEKIKFCQRDINSHCKERYKGCVPKKFKIDKVRVDELKEGDFLLSPIITRNKDFDIELSEYLPGKNKFKFKQKKTINGNIMRLFGYFLAEGSFNKRLGGEFKNIVFSFNIKEKETFASEVKNLLQSELGCKANIIKTGDSTCIVTGFGKKICELFYKHCGAYSHYKQVSQNIMDCSPDLQLELIKTFINGDGYIDKRGDVYITTASKQLANQTQEILKRCQIMSIIYREERNTGFAGKPGYSLCWKVVVKNNEAQKLKMDIQNTSRWDSHRRFIWNNFILLEIQAIQKKQYKGDVYNLRIAPEHSYVANGIAVANCNQWARYFFRVDPIVNNSISLHSEFPLTGFRNICDDPKIQKYFDNLAFDILKLPKLMSFMSLEYWKLGNCFKKDTQIKTIDGMKNIQNIVVGDIVLTHKNKFRLVTHIMERDIKENILQIKIDEIKDDLFCTKEHPFFEFKDGKEIETLAKDLTLQSVVKTILTFKTNQYYKIKEIKEIYYEGKVYNFSVKEDESYIANNVVVHNCFPFGTWNDSKGRWENFIVLNPDYVEIESNVFAGEPIIKLDPDDSLKRIIQSKQPLDIYNKIDPQIVAYVSKGQKVPLSNFVIEVQGKEKIEIPQVSHLAFKNAMYEAYGLPLMYNIFKVLIYKDMIRRAQFAIVRRHWKPIKVVKIGDETHHASEESLTSVEEGLRQASSDPESFFIWHNYIQFDYLGSSGHIIPMNTEYEWIDKELMAGLFISRAVLTGDGPTFASASVGLQVLINRYLRFQKILSDWIIDYVYKPVARVQQFYRVNKDTGEQELIVPKIEWGLMRLKDDAQQKSLLQTLHSKKLISSKTLLTYLNIDPEEEERTIREETEKEMQSKKELQMKQKELQVQTPSDAGAGIPPMGGGEIPPEGGGVEMPSPEEGTTPASGAMPGEVLPPREGV